MLQSVDESLAILRHITKPLGVVSMNPVLAHGLVLASPVLLEHDSPPFDRALLDGFAVRAEDARAGVQLEIIGGQDAGGPVWEGELSQGKCVAINTGGVLPKGADGVLMVEHSEKIGLGFVKVLKTVGVEVGVQRRGAHGRARDVAVESGRRLGAAGIAAAVGAGAGEVRVWRRPRVGVLSTGDELVRVGEVVKEGEIWNSNQPMLMALVKEAGGEVLDLGQCGDEAGELRGKLERGLAEADVLVVTGGMSMGSRDLVPGMLKEMGVAVHVEKVRMKPGKPFLFGTLEGKEGEGVGKKYVAGLPGNPVSAFVTFELFVREMLGILGGGEVGKRFVEAEAGSVFGANGDREFFQPCALERRGAGLVARAFDWRGSADILTLAKAGGLVRRKVDAGEVRVGERVEVLPLG